MSIHQGNSLRDDKTLEADVCVIGSGAGGAVAAERLAHAGKRVVILEEGGYHTAEEFTMREMQMMELLYQDKGARATKDLSIMVLQGRAVGGGTVINGTICYRTPEQTVERWREDHGVTITHEELVPHWERTEQRLNIQKIPLELVNKNNRVLWDGAKKLGWQVDTTMRNVKNCAHLGYCFMACPTDAKQAMHITLLPDAMRAGADLYADCRVDTIEASGRKIATVRASVLDTTTHQPTGAKVTVNAKWVVLAGGAINSPALLLRSKLGNASGRVGKRTFLHPVVASLSEFDEPVDLYYGSTATMGSHQWAYWGADRKGFFMEVAALHPSGAGSLMPGFGKAMQDRMGKLNHMNVVGSLIMDGFDTGDFDEGATVTLGDRGQPVVDYKWSEKLCEAMREGQRRAAQVQLAAGARRAMPTHSAAPVIESEADLKKLDNLKYGPNLQPNVTYHQMGGCCMGADSKTSVVDSNLRHHEFDNLFVLDGSVFPTSLGVNSQHSIYGIASYGVAKLIEAMG